MRLCVRIPDTDTRWIFFHIYCCKNLRRCKLEKKRQKVDWRTKWVVWRIDRISPLTSCCCWRRRHWRRHHRRWDVADVFVILRGKQKNRSKIFFLRSTVTSKISFGPMPNSASRASQSVSLPIAYSHDELFLKKMMIDLIGHFCASQMRLIGQGRKVDVKKFQIFFGGDAFPEWPSTDKLRSRKFLFCTKMLN